MELAHVASVVAFPAKSITQRFDRAEPFIVLCEVEIRNHLLACWTMRSRPLVIDGGENSVGGEVVHVAVAGLRVLGKTVAQHAGQPVAELAGQADEQVVTAVTANVRFSFNAFDLVRPVGWSLWRP